MAYEPWNLQASDRNLGRDLDSQLLQTIAGRSLFTGMAGASKPFSVGPYTTLTNNFTLATQLQAPANFTGLRLVIFNPYTRASTLTGARVSSPADSGNNGSALSFTPATFVEASGVAGTTSIALPVAIGTDPNITSQTLIVSDHMALAPASALNLIHVRYDFAGDACAMTLAAGEMAAFNTATGYNFQVGNIAGANSVAAITMSATPGQVLPAGGVIWTFDRPARTVAVVGGSMPRGPTVSASPLGQWCDSLERQTGGCASVTHAA